MTGTERNEVDRAVKDGPGSGDETFSRLAPDRDARPREGQEDSLVVLHACAALITEKKGERPLILEVGDLTSYADYFLIASAPSERQVTAIAAHVEDTLRRAGIKPMGVEGRREGNWVLLDFGNFVIHVFLDSARYYYDLEGFWSDAKRIPFDEASGLETLEDLKARAA